MVAMSRDMKSATSEGDRRRLVDQSLDRRDWRDVGSGELLHAWKAVVCFRCECTVITTYVQVDTSGRSPGCVDIKAKRIIYLNSTYVLMSTKSREQPDVSPCGN